MFRDANTYADTTNPIFAKGVGIVSALFFSLGIYVSVRQLLANQLILIIDKNGVNIDPKKSLNEIIDWKYIEGFSEFKIQNQKFVAIDVNNPDYWIEKEENGVRKELMKFNLSHYGSPFNLSAVSMQINYTELMKILRENFNKYKQQP